MLLTTSIARNQTFVTFGGYAETGWLFSLVLIR